MTRDDAPARAAQDYEPEDNAPHGPDGHGPDGHGLGICIIALVAIVTGVVLAWAVLA